jgi:RNA polymerase sigma-70 factor (ECF subfamily)
MAAVRSAVELRQAGDAPKERPRWLGWVASARHGDRAAFASLHDHFCGMVHGILVARVSTHEAKDLTQDVFLIAMQKLPTLEQDLAFGGWLAQIARTHAARHHRDHPVHDELPEEIGQAAGDVSAAPDVRKVLEALREMPEAYAETLAMRLIDGLSGPEISERTGLTPGSVRVNLHRGMGLLRKKLGWEKPEGASDE